MGHVDGLCVTFAAAVANDDGDDDDDDDMNVNVDALLFTQCTSLVHKQVRL